MIKSIFIIVCIYDSDKSTNSFVYDKETIKQLRKTKLIKSKL